LPRFGGRVRTADIGTQRPACFRNARATRNPAPSGERYAVRAVRRRMERVDALEQFRVLDRTYRGWTIAPRVEPLVETPVPGRSSSTVELTRHFVQIGLFPTVWALGSSLRDNSSGVWPARASSIRRARNSGGYGAGGAGFFGEGKTAALCSNHTRCIAQHRFLPMLPVALARSVALKYRELGPTCVRPRPRHHVRSVLRASRGADHEESHPGPNVWRACSSI
jgi:hypothetical protein